MKSSYLQNNYANVFRALTFNIKPSLIVEFGVLDGYSLNALVASSGKYCSIFAYDLFDDFPYNAADRAVIEEMFKENPNVHINKADFYKSVDKFADDSINIMHIDIANNGDTFQFAVENYLPKIAPGGIMILEGGSKERDEYEWMKKYNKKPIVPYLESIKEIHNFMVLEDFPSITIFKK